MTLPMMADTASSTMPYSELSKIRLLLMGVVTSRANMPETFPQMTLLLAGLFPSN